MLLSSSFIATCAISAWGEEALSKFTGNFECDATESPWGNLCIEVDIDLDAFWIGTCGYNVFKGLDIVSKSPTRIVITSTNSDRADTRLFDGKPDTSFFYVLTDTWKYPKDEGKEFRFDVYELDQSGFSKSDGGSESCVKQITN